MPAEIAPNLNQAYQQEKLAIFEENIKKAKDRLGEIYAPAKPVSVKEYTRTARELIRRSSEELFEMQLFPIHRVQEARTPNNAHTRAILDEALLEFRGTTGPALFLGLDGTIYEKSGTIRIHDPEGNGEAYLDRGMLSPINTDWYRQVATLALDALGSRAIAHAYEIQPMRPVFSGGDLLELPKAA